MQKLSAKLSKGVSRHLWTKGSLRRRPHLPPQYPPLCAQTTILVDYKNGGQNNYIYASVFI